MADRVCIDCGKSTTVMIQSGVKIGDILRLFWTCPSCHIAYEAACDARDAMRSMPYVRPAHKARKSSGARERVLLGPILQAIHHAGVSSADLVSYLGITDEAMYFLEMGRANLSPLAKMKLRELLLGLGLRDEEAKIDHLSPAKTGAVDPEFDIHLRNATDRPGEKTVPGRYPEPPKPTALQSRVDMIAMINKDAEDRKRAVLDWVEDRRHWIRSREEHAREKSGQKKKWELRRKKK